MKLYQITLAAAIAAIAAGAQAEDYGKNVSTSYSESYSSSDTSLSIEKDIEVSKDVEYEGGVDIDGNINVDSLGMAVTNTSQSTDWNLTTNELNENDADVDNGALKNAEGNIGVNVAAGDNNAQSNAAALAATDAQFVLGSADAEIFNAQAATMNTTYNLGSINDASISNAMQNVSGNVGVNVAAGANNAQGNSLAGSVAAGTMAEATVATAQTSADNMTDNVGSVIERTHNVQVSLRGGMEGGYAGFGKGAYQGASEGTYTGTADQIGDVYPDVWGENENQPVHDQHPHSPEHLGHIDLDTQTEGGVDLNGDGGALAFGESGTLETEEKGKLGFVEVGGMELGGSFSGQVTTYHYEVVYSQNNAELTNGALANATGNIGANIAAGTNNLQSNSLAVSVVRDAPTAMPAPGVEQ